MEESVLLACKGDLVQVCTRKTAIELENFRFCGKTNFDCGPVSKSTLTSKLHWKIEDVRNIVDERTGIDAPVILASCNDTSNIEKRFCVIQTLWKGNHSNVVCKSKGRTSESSQTRTQHQLSPCFEFSWTATVSNPKWSCVLLYGPRALVFSQNRLSLFCLKSNTKNTIEKYYFSVCDGNIVEQNVNPSARLNNGDTDNSSQPESTILSVISEEDWVVALLRLQGKSTCYLYTVALERDSEHGDFKKYDLRTKDFFPPEYAPKVSSVEVDHCEKVGEGVFTNVCCVGLKDGYVIAFTNGVVQTCVALWSHVNAVYPAFAVTEIQVFSGSMVVCCTDARHCFILDLNSKQVVQHWEGVDRAVVGDFLHCGRQQVLLLFTRSSPFSFLLTDLQGTLVDRRLKEDASSSSSLDESVDNHDDEPFRNLQPVVAALQEQNQSLARRVAEEEQRLRYKRQFMTDTWQRLHALSLQGTGRHSTDVPPPEVPLLGLVGRDQRAELPVRRSLTLRHHDDVEVKAVWQRMVDSVCVIGVKMVNTSHRELVNCCLTLTSPSSLPPHTRLPHQRGVTTRMWQCLRSQSHHALSDGQAAKRRRMEPQLHVRETRSVQPLECVTVTCLFDVAELGRCGDVSCFVHLIYEVNGGKDSVVGSGLENVGACNGRETQKLSCEDNTAIYSSIDVRTDFQSRQDVTGTSSATETQKHSFQDRTGTANRNLQKPFQDIAGTSGTGETHKSDKDSFVTSSSSRNVQNRFQSEAGTSSAKETQKPFFQHSSATCSGIGETRTHLSQDVKQNGGDGSGESIRSQSVAVGERKKNVSCGDVTLRVTDILRQSPHSFTRLLSQQDNGGDDLQPDAEIEEDILTLNAIQQQWSCDVSFSLHEATDLIPDRLLTAGLVFHPTLGQYVMNRNCPPCLYAVRVQMVGLRPLPRRSANVIVFARDLNQFLLTLRHLYNHLPDDATITMATQHRESNIQRLASLMSAQLCDRKRYARSVLQTGKHAHTHNNSTAEQITDLQNLSSFYSSSSRIQSIDFDRRQIPEAQKRTQDDSTDKKTSFASGVENERSKNKGFTERQIQEAQKSAQAQNDSSANRAGDQESLMFAHVGGEGEGEEFESKRRQYRESQARCLGKEDVWRFKAALRDCETETDMALAKLKL